MPSESDRWKTGPLRNTIGHTHGPTGAVTGGVTGHVTSEELEGADTAPGARAAERAGAPPEAQALADDEEEILGGG